MGAIELILVRHGESEGNVANALAQGAGSEVITVPDRDADVPLSALGTAQARALGADVAGWDRPPEAVWCSPYTRAEQTAVLALREAGSALPVRFDERLRDRELGVLDLLTPLGVERRFGEEAVRRRWLGKFYYRPPGGESWADMALRLRSVLRDIDDEEPGRRVLIVAHDAVIMVLRYVCERMREADLLELANAHAVRNASVTRLVRPQGRGRWDVADFNADEHLRTSGVPITEHGGTRDDLQP